MTLWWGLFDHERFDERADQADRRPGAHPDPGGYTAKALAEPLDTKPGEVRTWFRQTLGEGLESAFRSFGGTTEEVLLDNARALVERHDAQTREVTFNARFLAFAKHWEFRPAACAPYRARTKGKSLPLGLTRGTSMASGM